VFTVTGKVPAAGIIVFVTVTVIWELLTTVVASVAPLKTRTEEETNSLPVAVRVKLGGSCAKIIVAGEIDFRTGAGRALPQSGFNELHPGTSETTTSNRLRRIIRLKEGMECPDSIARTPAL
jgi:hypothetical protein